MYEKENPWCKVPELTAFALGHRGTVWDEEEFIMFMFIICEKYGDAGCCMATEKFGIHLYNSMVWEHKIYEDLLEEQQPKELSVKQMRDALGRLHNKKFIKLTMKSNRSIIMQAEIIV